MMEKRHVMTARSGACSGPQAPL